MNHSNHSPLAPSLAAGLALTHSTQNSRYTHDRTSIDWDSERRHQDNHVGPKSQSAAFKKVKPGTSEDEFHGQKNETSMEVDDANAQGQSDTKNPPHEPDDDPSSSNSPLLSPVLEERSSSISEGNDYNGILLIPEGMCKPGSKGSDGLRIQKNGLLRLRHHQSTRSEEIVMLHRSKIKAKKNELRSSICSLSYDLTISLWFVGGFITERTTDLSVLVHGES